MRTLSVPLTPVEVGWLDEVVEFLKEKRSQSVKLTPERWVYLTVRDQGFKWNAALLKLEKEGFIEQNVPAQYSTDGTAKSIRLEPKDIPFDAFRAPEKPTEGEFTFRMPEAILQRVERGAALQAALNRPYGQVSAQYTQFRDWMNDIVRQTLITVKNGADLDKMQQDEEQVYPGINDVPAVVVQSAPPPAVEKVD